MNVPIELYQQAMDQNRYRMERMVARMQMHVNLGCKFSFMQWNLVKHNGVAYRIEGVLISTMRYNYIHMFPEGSYECAECGMMKEMDYKRKCYGSTSHGMLVCPSCADDTFDQPLMASLTHVSEWDVKTDACISIINETSTEEELCMREEESMKNLEGLKDNMNSEFIYVQNKTMATIRAEFLAKRVIRKWRAHVRHQVQSKVFKILYHCVNMDMNAAVMLSKTVCV